MSEENLSLLELAERESAAVSAPADPPSDPPAEPPADPPETPAAESSDPPEPPAESEETGELDEPTRQFFDDFKATTGIDLSGEYTSREAALRGLAEANRMVGRRNEEASYWQALTQRVAGKEDRFRKFLESLERGEEPAAPPPAAEVAEPLQSIEEFRLLQSSLYDEDGKPRQGADPKLRERLTQASQKIQQVAFDLAYRPEKVIGPLIEKVKAEVLEQATQQSQTALGQQQIREEWSRVSKEHGAALMEGGDPQRPTAFGEKVAEEYRDLLALGAPEGPQAYRKAIAMATAAMPRPNPTRKTTSRATAVPAAAMPAVASEDIEELFRTGKRTFAEQAAIDAAELAEAARPGA